MSIGEGKNCNFRSSYPLFFIFRIYLVIHTTCCYVIISSQVSCKETPALGQKFLQNEVLYIVLLHTLRKRAICGVMKKGKL